MTCRIRRDGLEARAHGVTYIPLITSSNINSTINSTINSIINSITNINHNITTIHIKNIIINNTSDHSTITSRTTSLTIATQTLRAHFYINQNTGRGLRSGDPTNIPTSITTEGLKER